MKREPSWKIPSPPIIIGITANIVANKEKTIVVKSCWLNERKSAEESTY
ncbi:MAG: hypothetical protein WED07_16465 [Candidatus Freyarchaeum deiterrae]